MSTTGLLIASSVSDNRDAGYLVLEKVLGQPEARVMLLHGSERGAHNVEATGVLEDFRWICCFADGVRTVSVQLDAGATH